MSPNPHATAGLVVDMGRARRLARLGVAVAVAVLGACHRPTAPAVADVSAPWHNDWAPVAASGEPAPAAAAPGPASAGAPGAHPVAAEIVAALREAVAAATEHGGAAPAPPAPGPGADPFVAAAAALVRDAAPPGGEPVLLATSPADRLGTLAEAFAALESHGIAPPPEVTASLRERAATLTRLAAAREEHRGAPFDDALGRALWDATLDVWDARGRSGATSAPNAEALAPLRTSVPLDLVSVAERLPVVHRWLADLAATEAAWRAALLAADEAALGAFVHYAYLVRLRRVTNPYRPPDVPETRLAHKKVVRTLSGLIAAAQTSLPETLHGLLPTHPVYEAIRATLGPLRARAAEGGYPPVTTTRRLKRGMRGADVGAVRARLQAEGFAAEGSADGDLFDGPLREAVVRFQRQRGIAPLGEVGPQTVAALNVTAADRVRQVELSLQRWRESPLRDAAGRAIRVNLPAYELVLWDGATPTRRHAVIIGSDRLQTDLATNQIGHLNRTRLLASDLYQVILNPYWRVPRRIAIQEIGPKAERDPKYLAEQGIRVQRTGTGEPLLIQAPGPNNPLGVVKFLFRNDYALYLHDTDKRWLFAETRRDFSHGCVRVADPLELARELAAGVDGSGVGADEFRRLLRMGTEYGIDLAPTVPIHLEYNTVEVAADGAVHFLPDVYEYDRAVLRGTLPAWQSRPLRPSEIERAKQAEPR